MAPRLPRSVPSTYNDAFYGRRSTLPRWCERGNPRNVGHDALKPTTAVLFSGGLDSAILLAHLLAQNHRVRPLYVDSQLVWQRDELSCAKQFLQAVATSDLEPIVVLKLPLGDLYDGHWSVTGRGIPAAVEPDENVYLPGRNPLLMIKPLVWCGMHGIAQLALGSLASNPFADATSEFFASFQAAMDRALSGHVELIRPLASLDKRAVMQLGRELPLELTLSCLAPRASMHCGACNKCAERQHAFRHAGLKDPTSYAVSARAVAG
jgi:7-cyano-7-deazaguanine synthase